MSLNNASPLNGLKPQITRDLQRYVDEPIVVRPCRPSGVALAVAAAFGRSLARPPITVGYERVLLRWVKPDGRGGLVPRENQGGRA